MLAQASQWDICEFWNIRKKSWASFFLSFQNRFLILFIHSEAFLMLNMAINVTWPPKFIILFKFKFQMCFTFSTSQHKFSHFWFLSSFTISLDHCCSCGPVIFTTQSLLPFFVICVVWVDFIFTWIFIFNFSFVHFSSMLILLVSVWITNTGPTTHRCLCHTPWRWCT